MQGSGNQAFFYEQRDSPKDLKERKKKRRKKEGEEEEAGEGHSSGGCLSAPLL